MHTHVFVDTHMCTHTHRLAAHSLAHLENKSAVEVSVISGPHVQMVELALTIIQKKFCLIELWGERGDVEKDLFQR